MSIYIFLDSQLKRGIMEYMADQDNKLDNIRHSLAHLLAMAVLEYDPDVKLAIGPTIENGFYYDFEFSKDKTPDPENLPIFKAKMQKLISENLDFKHIETNEKDARKRFKDQPYKLELIDEFVKSGEKLTMYSTCPHGTSYKLQATSCFIDLCRGGHVDSTKKIDPQAFSLTHIAGAYWRGNEKNTMLTRIYGVAFATKKELNEYFTQQEEAKKRDHKKLGKELDLFFIDEEVGKGLPMWTPKGTIIKYELENFTRELERKYNYEHIATPYLGGEKLYQTSGHLDHFKENMYAPIDMDGDIVYLRPMACPHHIKMYMRKPVSYRDMPIRYAEIADYNRYEKSGELMGMIRVRKFELTDAHIFVDPEELKEEFKQVCSLVREGLEKLGIAEKVSYRFSKHDPNDKHKYFSDEKLWAKAEQTMKEALDEIGCTYDEIVGEAAFYGPKLDVQIKNVNGKEDTIFTAQIDFLLPEKFDLTYTDKNGEKKRPVMIHRSAIGALERTFAFLIEHYAGAFPLWLSPVHIKVLPISEAHKEYANKIFKLLKENDIRAELDTSDETLGKKIRKTKLEKIPYFLVIGDKEIAEKKVKVESRDGDTVGTMAIEDLIKKLKEEIAKKK